MSKVKLHVSVSTDTQFESLWLGVTVDPSGLAVLSLSNSDNQVSISAESVAALRRVLQTALKLLDETTPKAKR